MEENFDAMKVWSLVQGQRIIAGMNGITVDINHIAIWEIIDRYEIDNPIICFEKVLRIARETFQHEHVIRESNKK